MKLRTRLLAVGILAFIFAGGAGVAAYAVASSAEKDIGISSFGGCARATAWTYNDAGQNGKIIVKGYAAGVPVGCANGATHAKPAGHLGSSAFLKRASDGAICSSVGIFYNPASIVAHERFAWKGGCPSGQLAGGGTGYVYNGTGYSSATVQAPYQTF